MSMQIYINGKSTDLGNPIICNQELKLCWLSANKAFAENNKKGTKILNLNSPKLKGVDVKVNKAVAFRKGNTLGLELGNSVLCYQLIKEIPIVKKFNKKNIDKRKNGGNR